MATRSEGREYLPYVVELDGVQYELHPDGTVYRRVRVQKRNVRVHELGKRFRAESFSLRRVKNRGLLRSVREKAEGVSWTAAVGV